MMTVDQLQVILSPDLASYKPCILREAVAVTDPASLVAVQILRTLFITRNLVKPEHSRVQHVRV